MSLVNRKHSGEFQANADEQVLARWSVPVAHWKVVHKALVKEDMRSGLWAGLAAAGTFAFTLLFFFSNWVHAVLIGLLVGVVFGLLAHFLRGRLHAMNLGREAASQESVEVQLRSSGLLINGFDLVLWEGEHRKLERARCDHDPGFGFPTLDLDVGFTCGDSYVRSRYRIPVPEEKVEELQAAIE